MYVDVLIYYHKSCTIGRTFLEREIVNKKKKLKKKKDMGTQRGRDIGTDKGRDMVTDRHRD